MNTQCVISLIKRIELDHLFDLALNSAPDLHNEPPLPPYGCIHPEHEYAFGRLFDAVRFQPHQLNQLLAAERSLVTAGNGLGENVLHWMAVENRVQEIELLRGLGSPIPGPALVEAVEMGHAETVILLLELGVEVDRHGCRIALMESGLASSKRSLIDRYFRQFGHYLIDQPDTVRPRRMHRRQKRQEHRPNHRQPLATQPNRRLSPRRPANQLLRQLQALDD
ncbi:ankyrin repeat domain-containing protein [Metapseudomonas otitidis]|uniref:ankyrin repeat domain-containing protein n=1 Tax=Metapseudomonas otitidis TaxID=319939 RepID=UPI0013F5E770|nr:ankyrin repeat domain-containing protein [Pseudomonas otitidis]